MTMNVVFIDTTVFLNIINLDGRNDHRDQVMKTLKEYLASSNSYALILPLATIIEAGNHIAHGSNGEYRRRAAKIFCDCIEKMLNDEAPWKYYGEGVKPDDLRSMCKIFPEYALNEVGFGDISIIQAYEKYKTTVPGVGHISIWSLDSHLAGYSEDIPIKKRR